MAPTAVVRNCLLALLAALAAAAPAAAFPLPELPRVLVDTAPAAQTGRSIAVAAGGSLQAALDAAQPGDTVVLAAGASFVGNFRLPNKSGAGWITVRTSTPDSALPAPGTRIGPTHAPLLARVLTPNSSPAIATAAGAHHYRLVGLEVTVAPGVSSAVSLVQLGAWETQTSAAAVPHHLVLDRLYVHGAPAVSLRRGIALNSAFTAVVDSHVAEAHHPTADAQAIAGWNGPGPFKLVNNHLEGSGENVMFGGGDPAIDGLVPSDIEIRRNHFTKPLSWRPGDPSYAGRKWAVKNLFELKNAQRVLIDGNVFEHNWADAQNGFGILFTPRNQDGASPWSVVQDVTFTNNLVRHSGAGINIIGTDDIHPSQRASRLLIANNLFTDIDGARWGGCGCFLSVLNGPSDLVLDHNTVLQTGDILWTGWDVSHGFVFQNSIVPHRGDGVSGEGTAGNALATLAAWFPGAVFTRNVIPGGTPSRYPPDNAFPASLAAVGFADLAGGDYRLAAGSPHRLTASDGTDPGVDVDELEAAMAGGAGGGADTQPPVVAAVTVGSVTAASAVVTWTTDEAADSVVEYGPTTAYGAVASGTGLVTAHAVRLDGLLPATRYHVRVRSRDAAGNLATSGDVTFTTGAAGTGPAIAITSPAPGAVVSGPVMVSATASSSAGVAHVTFRVDGARRNRDYAAPYAFTWRTGSLRDGVHTLIAVAQDRAGNVVTSAPVTVTVKNRP